MPDESDLPAPLPRPPATPEERIAWLQLIRSHRVGPATFYRLMADHGSAAAALAALPEVARSAGVVDYRPWPEAQARTELRAGTRIGAQLVALGTPGYPPMLASLADPPPLLWMIGNPAVAARPTVALVGTRQATSLGLRMARVLAADLGAAGVSVVSGLARGIDAAAHQGSLATGTIAVMPGGVDILYPPEHETLARDIARDGLRLSDQPIGLRPQQQHFIRRNRLIAGVASLVVVVEAPVRSGALITARDALDAGREVLAVPGHPMDSRASGCNLLLRDGAVLVRSAEDILELLEARGLLPTPAAVSAAPPEAAQDGNSGSGSGPPARQKVFRAVLAKLSHTPADTSGAQAGPASLPERILGSLSAAPVTEDQLSRDLGLDPADLGLTLSAMEIDGRITRRPGGLLTRSG